jgi:hypothetical protein
MPCQILPGKPGYRQAGVFGVSTAPLSAPHHQCNSALHPHVPQGTITHRSACWAARHLKRRASPSLPQQVNGQYGPVRGELPFRTYSEPLVLQVQAGDTVGVALPSFSLPRPDIHARPSKATGIGERIATLRPADDTVCRSSLVVQSPFCCVRSPLGRVSGVDLCGRGFPTLSLRVTILEAVATLPPSRFPSFIWTGACTIASSSAPSQLGGLPE